MSGHYVWTLCLHKWYYAWTFGQYARKMSDVWPLFLALETGAHNWKKREGGGSMKWPCIWLKSQFLPTLVVLLNLSYLFLRRGREAWSFNLYSQMTRLWEPSRGSEIVSKLTEGSKNRLEVFCGALRSPVGCSSCTGSAIRVDRPETMHDHSSSIASTLGSLERELRVIKATIIDHQAWFLADRREWLNRRSYNNLQTISRFYKKTSSLFFGPSVSFDMISDPRKGSQSLVIWLYKSKLQASLPSS